MFPGVWQCALHYIRKCMTPLNKHTKSMKLLTVQYPPPSTITTPSLSMQKKKSRKHMNIEMNNVWILLLATARSESNRLTLTASFKELQMSVMSFFFKFKMYAITVCTFIHKHFWQWNKTCSGKDNRDNILSQGHVNSVWFSSRHSNRYSSPDTADIYLIFCALLNSLTHGFFSAVNTPQSRHSFF